MIKTSIYLGRAFSAEHSVFRSTFEEGLEDLRQGVLKSLYGKDGEAPSISKIGSIAPGHPKNYSYYTVFNMNTGRFDKRHIRIGVQHRPAMISHTGRYF